MMCHSMPRKQFACVLLIKCFLNSLDTLCLMVPKYHGILRQNIWVTCSLAHKWRLRYIDVKMGQFKTNVNKLNAQFANVPIKIKAHTVHLGMGVRHGHWILLRLTNWILSGTRRPGELLDYLARQGLSFYHYLLDRIIFTGSMPLGGWKYFRPCFLALIVVLSTWHIVLCAMLLAT